MLTYDNYAGRERPTGGTYGTSGSASVFVNGSDFTARNLTIENSFVESSVDVQNKQAVALNVRVDRHQFINVRFLGNQDTLLTNGGTQYFYQCYIEGDVDFIFGGSRAVFEESVIHSLDRGSSSNNGYITAASTMITEPFGYLFLNSKLTSDAAAGTVWLGRPWHPGGNPDAIASVLFMNTEMGAHINPIGWTDMSGFLAKDAIFAEYQNYGPGAVITDTRPQLTDEEAAEWTIEKVLKGWNPKGE
ncbi:pectinesterase family protein [Paenibacillus alkaliterrae]